MLDFSKYPKFKANINKTILAVDYGFKVTGTAIFKVGNDPFPLMHEKILYTSEKDVEKKLIEIIKNESIDIVLFGVPYLLDGKESEHTKKTKLQGEKLKSLLGDSIEFYFCDETLTTKAAEDRMQNSPEFNFKIDPTKIDNLSAVIILEDYLRS